MKNQVYVKNKLEELEERIEKLEEDKASENFKRNVCKEFNIDYDKLNKE
jgi:uncharacterized protein (UPF0335 family)